MRISVKLTAWIALSIAAVLSVNGFLRMRQELEQLERDARRDHYTLSYGLALAMVVVAERSGPDEALAFLEDANVRESRIYIRWVPARGEAGRDTFPAEPESDLIRSTVERGGAEGREFLVTRVPLDLPGAGEGYIELRESLDELTEHVEQIVTRTIIVVLLTVLVCTALILAFGWVVVGRPVFQLVEKVRRIGDGDLAGPVDLRQRDEMGELGREINAMCERLLAADERAERETEGRIRAIEQLRHADRLSTIGKLASGLAHEVGTPLNVLLARAQMIRRGESEGNEVREDAGVIVEQGEKIARIIRHLLDFARSGTPLREPEDLRGPVRNAVGLLEPLAAKNGVALVLEQSDTPVVADIDAGRIQQVLTNLVMNAIQAQPDGGEVRVHVVRDEERRQSRIEVEDDGPGVPVELRHRIFEPFFTTKDIGDGTGLGLSVAYGIVQEHGGRLAVEEGSGGGARFVIRLPWSRP
jgi:signal transduction histidine kinase